MGDMYTDTRMLVKLLALALVINIKKWYCDSQFMLKQSLYWLNQSKCWEIGMLKFSAVFLPVCTSHGVQQVGDIVDILLVSRWRKLDWKNKFTRSRQSGCWKRSVRWVIMAFTVCSTHGLCSSTCWAKQTHTTDRQWAYYCTCHIFLILRELYVAMLRIVQLAFSIKPCPLSQIRLTTQTGLYNRWIVECAVDGYTVSLCRQLQAWICRPDHHQNSR